MVEFSVVPLLTTLPSKATTIAYFETKTIHPSKTSVSSLNQQQDSALRWQRLRRDRQRLHNTTQHSARRLALPPASDPPVKLTNYDVEKHTTSGINIMYVGQRRTRLQSPPRLARRREVGQFHARFDRPLQDPVLEDFGRHCVF